MTTNSGIKAHLKELYTRRQVRRVVYFHCDHWEPWRRSANEREITAKSGDQVMSFLDQMEKVPFARRLSLFYSPRLPTALTGEPKPGRRAHPEDAYLFPPYSAERMAIVTPVMRHLSQNTGHELQVHVHHENCTFTVGGESSPLRTYLASPTGRRHEEARFDLLVKLHLEAIEAETGTRPTRWFFVHGHWALNASDADSCHLVREIEILMANGCAGDFTFPAGRAKVNPRLETPYFCRPVSKAKGYDLQESEPEAAYANANAAPSKFFIWASPIKHQGASLDYYADWLRQRLDGMLSAAEAVIEQSLLIDGTLFIKTHAHSLHPSYFDGVPYPIFPLAYPKIQTLLSLLFEAADSAGATVDFMTASEVYGLFVTATPTAHPQLDLVIPGTPTQVEAIQPPPPLLPLPGTDESEFHAASLFGGGLDEDNIRAANRQAVATLATCEERLASPLLALLPDRDTASVAQRKPISNRSIAVARALARATSPDQTICHFGCAIGMTAILVARTGRRAIGIDHNPLCIDVARSLERDLRSAAGAIGTLHADENTAGTIAPCSFVVGTFPACLSGVNGAGSVAVFTEFSTGMDAGQLAGCMTALSGFDVIVLDPSRFAGRQTTPAQQTAIIEIFASHGFAPPREILNLGRHGQLLAFDAPGLQTRSAS